VTRPADPPNGAGNREGLRLLAITACPTGIAHTYMAAEKLQQAAEALGVEMKVETQGSIGAENVLTDNDVKQADGVIIAADKNVDLARFVGKRVLSVGVSEGISHPERLIEQVRSAPVHAGDGSAPSAAGGGGRERGVAYKALMNGVSYMIPFVVVGGLLLAVSLALGGHPDPSGGLVIPKGSFWAHVNDIGTIGFTLMVPILSGYIAYAIGDRPALVPGMIGGWIANTGALYDSKAGAGFIGAIVTGFLAGYLVVWIKKVRVPKFVQPIMPIIVIPIVATTALGLFFIYVIGKPISWVFAHLTSWLSGMTGSSAIVLGAVLGLMIAFDMGGPVNKTAFLFGAGLIASGNQTVMGMCAAAIPVMPLGQGLATLVRRRLYTAQERETGIAALFMGCFGISEGAIPFAAARPAKVIPANMLGGAVAGAVAGMAGVKDAVPHGGPIVAVLGAVGGVPLFFAAAAIGTVVTALTTVALVSLEERGEVAPSTGSLPVPVPEPALTGTTARSASPLASTTPVTPSTATAAPRPATAAAKPPATATAAEPAAETEPATTTAAPTPTTAAPTRLAEPSAPPAVPAPVTEEASTASATTAVAAPPPGVEVLSGYLTERTVREELAAVDKEAAIREMAGLLAETGKVADVDALVAAALDREAQGTTGLGEEIAIPHAKTDAVTAPVVGFARSGEGIEWGALDGTKARLIFMISVPEAAAGDEHLRILALLSRKLMDTGFRERLATAPTRAEIMRVLAEVQ
jgi:PTS system fructose-specific IIC component